MGDQARAAELLAQEAHLNGNGLRLEQHDKDELESLFLKHERYGQAG